MRVEVASNGDEVVVAVYGETVGAVCGRAVATKSKREGEVEVICLEMAVLLRQ